MNNKFQLIKPFVSDRIYQTSSMNKAAKKCYQEVKEANLTNIDTFTMLNVDTKEKYVYQIHGCFRGKASKTSVEITSPKTKLSFNGHDHNHDIPNTQQVGGDCCEQLGDVVESVVGVAEETQKSGTIINKLQSNINSLESRVKTLEMMISNSSKQQRNIDADDIVDDRPMYEGKSDCTIQ